MDSSFDGQPSEPEVALLRAWGKSFKAPFMSKNNQFNYFIIITMILIATHDSPFVGRRRR